MKSALGRLCLTVLPAKSLSQGGGRGAAPPAAHSSPTVDTRRTADRVRSGCHATGSIPVRRPFAQGRHSHADRLPAGLNYGHRTQDFAVIPDPEDAKYRKEKLETEAASVSLYLKLFHFFPKIFSTDAERCRSFCNMTIVGAQDALDMLPFAGVQIFVQ